jgi:hypothetical protein
VLDVIKREGDSPQDVSVYGQYGQNGEVYWVNYVDPMHTVMRTSYSNETINLNISDPGEIKIAQDQHYLYALIPSNNTIYKYQKNTWALMGTIDVPSGTNGIEIAFGMYLSFKIKELSWKKAPYCTTMSDRRCTV